MFDGGGNARWLLASDASTGRIYVYDRSKDDQYVGAVAVSGRDGPVSNPGGLYAISAPAVSSNTGVLLVADEDASAGSNYKIVRFDRIATALRIPAGSPQSLTAAVTPKFPTVQPVIETQPVAHAGDAADDPAIWANSLNPAASLIVGTDKKGGLHVYDMQGRSRDFVPDGKMNNVDLRGGFRLGGEEKVLVTASDRTNKAIAIYTLDTEAAKLVNVADGIQATGLSDPYGLCMYRSKRTGRTYVYTSDPDGLVRQWELTAVKGDKVRAKKVRDIRFGSQTEGCVADDQRGLLYVAEEDVALWRIDAEPKPGATPSIVDKVASNPKLKADLEGIGLYDLGGGRGYLVLSSQGNNSYAIYRREGDNAYVGSFAVNADASRGIDGVSETDGLDVSSANLGPGLEQGAMVAQDGRNLLPAENQNFKVVPWSSIERALNLESGK